MSHKQKKESPKKVGRKTAVLDKGSVNSQHINDSQKSSLKSIYYWLKKHIIHFGYRGNGIMIALFVLLIYKAFTLYTLGIVDTHSFFGVIHWCIEWLGNELLYVFLVRLFVLLGMRIKNKRIKSIFIFIASVLLLFFIADIFALKNFNSRFIVSVFSFFTRENAQPYLGYALGSFLLFRVFLYVCVYSSSWIVAKKILPEKIFVYTIRWILILSGAIIGISFFLGKTSSYQQNVLQIQYKDSRWIAGKNDRIYEDYFIPFSGQNKQPNIIVVFAESFSSIDSLTMGGNNGLLSGFDTIAKHGRVYPNFVANGCTSDSAHIALLQGVEPWETNQLDQNYMRYKSYTLGLPAFLHQRGYNTTFVSTASLGFLDQKDFLTSLQFDTIIGSESFKNWKKYAFNAAPDEALYKKTQDILEKNKKSGNPQFIVLQTISSHKPYNSPLGNDENSAFRYSDNQLLQFYYYLQQQKFFENGLLIIVGDHRKMQSMSYEEIQKRGLAAYGKAVFTVLGKDIPKGTITNTPIQHLDIFSSIKRLVTSGSVNLHEYYNDIFLPYTGRENAIRYCQYVDKQYIGTRSDGSTRIILPSQKSIESSYVRSYYTFEGDRAVGKNIPGMVKNPNTSSFLHDSYISGTHISSGTDFVLSGSLPTILLQENYPDIVPIAHQGYHKTAPGNSLAAFVAAKNQGVNAIEMDITFTKDGYPVVAHGPDLGRIKCIGSSSVGKKNINDFTLQQIQDNCRLYNEQPVLTLQEVLSKTKDMFTTYFIDIKLYNSHEIDYISRMFDMVKKLGLVDATVFSSVDKNVNEKIIHTTDIVAGWEISDPKYLSEILEKGQKYILLPYDIVTEDIVNKIKKSDKILVVFTLQDKAIMEKLYSWGVRYFLTDDVNQFIK